jgi:hypothetical protein
MLQVLPSYHMTHRRMNIHLGCLVHEEKETSGKLVRDDTKRAEKVARNDTKIGGKVAGARQERNR